MAERLDMECTVGEDWNVQLTLLDEYDRPRPVQSHPGRMDVKGTSGVLVSLITDPDVDADPKPYMAISDGSATIQLSLPYTVTQNFSPGSYSYDLWLTFDGGELTGPQRKRELYGTFIVHNRVTEGF